jgi:hypothetical protein
MNKLQGCVQAIIALIVTVGYFIILAWAVTNGFPAAREGDQGMYILLGTLSTAFGGVLQYYFQTGVKKE